MGHVALGDEADTPKLAIIGGWLLLAAACVLAYFPGLAGPFVLDDFGAISGLGDRGSVSDWETFKAFVFSGHSGPTGRPLALLTFLIDGNTWPTDPFPFKRTNLVIHLLNGALLGVIISQILSVLRYDARRRRWIALVATACWLLHPFLVSTTLYAVQRMAQLSTLFVFLGVVVYLYGRSLLAQQPRKAYLVMSASIGICTLLAMISKENGILLPMLIGTVEITVFASARERSLNRYWAGLFIVLPTVVIGLYLGKQFLKDDFFDIVPPRDFSLYERMLTQPRILVDYLQHWFIPKLYTTGVFQDHFIKSTGILTPLTTLASVVVNAALVAAAFAWRRRWPLFALAVLFFYAGHALESTVLNLELYFEHRNYLSAALLFLPLVAVLYDKLDHRVFLAAAAAIALLLGGFTRYSATIWDNFPSMVEASARKAPTSARAQAQYATQLFNAGRYDESLQVIDRAIAILPNDNAHLMLNRLIILCNLDQLDPAEHRRVAGRLSAMYYDARLIKVYTSFAAGVAEGRCPDIAISDLRPMFAEMLDLPRNNDPTSLEYSHIKYLLGFVDVYRGDPAQAVAGFEDSLGARPGASHAMMMAALLASNDYLHEAIHLSDMALTQLEADRRSTQRGARVSEAEIREFQATVRADLEKRDAGSVDPVQ